jgi:hypothetical protein
LLTTAAELDPLASPAGIAWTENFSEPQIMGIGAVEVLGAIGLILPAAL